MNGTLLLIILVGAGIFFALRRVLPHPISQELSTKLLKEHPLILDVRTDAEYRNEHISKSVHIPLAELKSKIQRHAPDKNQVILLYCASGARSAVGQTILEKLGYSRSYNLGSISRARFLLSVHPSDPGTSEGR